MSPLLWSQWRIERVACPVAPGCTRHNCSMRSLGPHTQVIAFECALSKLITHNSLHIRAFVRTTSGYKPTRIDYTFDTCSVLGKSLEGASVFTRIIMQYMLADSNANRTCPIDGTVYFRNIRLSPDAIMNSFVPPDRYRVNFRFFDQRSNETLILAQIFIEATAA